MSSTNSGSATTSRASQPHDTQRLRTALAALSLRMSPQHESSGPQIRALFFLGFVFLGGHGNYFSIWLDHVGWDGAMIGWLDGARYACIVLFPVFWGRLADRLGDPVYTLRLVTMGSFVAFLTVLWTSSFLPLLIAMVLYSAFRVGFVPLIDTLTITHVEQQGGDYGRFRIWGSWGFVLGGFLLAGAVTWAGRDAIPPVLVGLLGLTVLQTFWMPRHRSRQQQSPGKTLPALRQVPGLPAFLTVTFFWRLTGQGLFLFLPIHLSDLGVSDSIMPIYWTIGVLSEILLLRNAPRWFGRFDPKPVLVGCFALCVVQYSLTAIIENPAWLLLVLTLHGFTFGLTYYTCVLWLGRHVPQEHRNTAQAVFQSLTFGVGGCLSSVIAGYLFKTGRGPTLFAVAGIASVATVIAALVLLRRETPPPASPQSD